MLLELRLFVAKFVMLLLLLLFFVIVFFVSMWKAHLVEFVIIGLLTLALLEKLGF